MTQTVLIFGATFIAVFTLGLQSLNVNQGHYLAAAVTSFFIGTGNILLYRYMPSAGLLEFAGYYLGGITGITSSMWFHRRAKAAIALWLSRRRAGRAADEHSDTDYCGGYQPRRMGGDRPAAPPPRFP
jgi:hypothetical protein